MQKFSNPHTIKAAIIAALVAITLVVFQPGTSGGFQLDDFDNLKEMEKYGEINDLQTFKAFVFSGISSLTGRPVSLASFVLDARSWPADPGPFLKTNIWIHALNGVLIFFILHKLLSLMSVRSRTTLFISAGTSLIWLIHPFHTSTVLYIVQRMTELSALFMLMGTLCYLHGRSLLTKAAGPGYLLMTGGIVLFGTIAIFAKENGVLLPLYIAVLELTLLRNVYKPEHWKHWSIPMLWIPTVAIFLYLISSALSSDSSFANRDFTLYERIITEPIILLDYLRRIFVPTTFPTVNYDDVSTAKSIWQPSALLASAAILTLLTSAALLIKRHPVISFAILWFFAGHILESTVLSLELYFEHRNYLPMLGPLFALAFYLSKFLEHKAKPVLVGFSAIIITFFAISWHNNGVWGDPIKLSQTWAEKQPNSVRAQMTYTLNIFKTQGEAQATARIEAFRSQFPDVLGIEILHTEVMCMKGELTREKVLNLINRLSTLPLDIHVGSNLSHFVDSTIQGYCRQIPPTAVLAIIQGLLKNKEVHPGGSLYSSLHIFKYKLHLAMNDSVAALKALDEAFRTSPSIDIALMQVDILMKMNQISAAKSQLNKAEALDRMRGRFIPSKRSQINEIREQLNAMERRGA